MIYLIRHGRTEFNVEGRFQGHCDSPLTPLGLEQAAANGARIKSLIGDPSCWRLETSPLGRALHTAQIIANVAGLAAPIPDDRLREVSLGSWDGLTDEDIALAYPDAAKGATRYDIFFRSPDGERFEALRARLQSWLDEALDDGRPRIAVSHGVAGRVLRGLYAGLDREVMLKLPTPQDAVFRLADGRIEEIAALALSEPGR
jgi:broad specificity phosphatase PhoE